MIFFIVVLRALAACLITNSHYVGIYPTNLIANGGLIGDVLFFAVSGYCLYHVKSDLSIAGFTQWYGKRIWRIYLPVVVMTFVYMILGAYKLSAEKGLIWWYLYPTNYHFVASIILLYIPYFFLVKIHALRNRIIPVMLGIAIVWMLVYWTVYDRSYYHIDTVREPMIRFLFMESMLLGAWYRQNDDSIRNHFEWKYLAFSAVSIVVYFASKMLLSKGMIPPSFQFINQITIFAVLVFLFKTFCGLDEKLNRMPEWIKRITEFLASVTLEIYVVQSVLISQIKALGLVFPINWIVLTGSILLAAFVLHWFCGIIYKATDKAMKRKTA